MAAKSRSARYYATHPEARRKKQKYDAKFNRKPEQVAKRVDLIAYNRKKGTHGNGDGLDASHKGRRIVGFSSQSRNRGDKNNSPGDRRARGRRR